MRCLHLCTFLHKCFSWHSQHWKVLAEQRKTWGLHGNWTVLSVSQCFLLTEWKPAGGQKGVAQVTVSCMGKSLFAQLPLQAKLALNRTKEKRAGHILERCKCSSTCTEGYLFKCDLGFSAWENFRTTFTDLFRPLQQEMAVTDWLYLPGHWSESQWKNRGA